ncbi:hypothetical protein IAU59_001952 [Kwoniella sp. CBS 9459]
MLTSQYIITVLSLLPFSVSSLLHSDEYSILQPAHGHPRNDLSVPFSPSSSRRNTAGTRAQARAIPVHGRTKRSPNHLIRKGDVAVNVGGEELDILERNGDESGSELLKRVQLNGTEVHLGSALNTFVVPISIGSPPVTYPLQLDLASSDLLLASTLCGDSCPGSKGVAVNPYYDNSKRSGGFGEINANQSLWNTSYADGTVASGFLVSDTVTVGEIVLQDQVIGLINSTNLTLSEQKISGILGLGFPRLSALSHALFDDLEDSSSASSTTTPSATSAADSASAASAASSTSSSARSTSTSAAAANYYPPLLEHLVRDPRLPYPVFGLALAPPPNASTTSTSSSSSAAPTSTCRYQTKTGSLTLGGVSSLYVTNDTATGRTIGDIEWHDVVPFGRASTSAKDSAGSIEGSNALSASASPSASASQGATRKRRSDETQLDSLPSRVDVLGGEEYLFWALELHHLALNGTEISINSSYADLGLPSIALLDAGFNGISGPQQDVIKLFAGITDARQVSEGRWAVPCNTKMTIGFSFGGRYIQLQPSDWIYAQITSSSFCLAWPIVAPSTGDGIDWQLGTPFLKKVYSVFSYGINGGQPPLVGFLPLEDTPSSSSASASSSESGSTSTAAVTATSTPALETSSPAKPTTIEALSVTTTIATALPNAVLPDPSYPTPTYVFSIDSDADSDGLAHPTQFLGLANSSAYSVGDVPIVTMDEVASSRIASLGGTGGGSGGSNAAGDGGGGGSSTAYLTAKMGSSGAAVLGMSLVGSVWVTLILT